MHRTQTDAKVVPINQCGSFMDQTTEIQDHLREGWTLLSVDGGMAYFVKYEPEVAPESFPRFG